VSVTVDAFADGHDLLAGVLQYRPAGPPLAPQAEPAPQHTLWAASGSAQNAQDDLWAGSGSAQNAADPASWIEVPLTDLGNDGWGASFGRSAHAGLFRRGVLVAGTLLNAKTIRLEPALNIPRPLVDEVLEKLDDTLKELTH